MSGPVNAGRMGGGVSPPVGEENRASGDGRQRNRGGGMMVGTHVAFGAFCAVSTALFLHLSAMLAILLLIGGMMGSLLPDIDHPKSWLGRRIPFLSRPIAYLFGHRGVTHSVLAVVGVFYAAAHCLHGWGLTLGQSMPLVLGLCVGYASHLLGDWLTPAGIPLLWPIRVRFRAPLMLLNGKFIEPMMAIGLWFGSGFLMAKTL
ncbi:metal-dependent hydrolase [Chromobacterium sp. IIBBL 290-4]|uniref:metal-dependent hydrolase n=1 Tax=Chromobacterium sp. IIBBL 290-4 TaxID=2953890 RepID=UPI0020B8A8C5|nr:metal-dependent hydrolase [Chromobacterium sp. IIBBL 290-4]UTH73627.1 metal-dependent hydrolase [Chromobacterium sp. IIBBL 290-4]